MDELRLSSPGRDIEESYAIDRPSIATGAELAQWLSNLVGNALSHGASNEPVRVAQEPWMIVQSFGRQ